jgi:hypothetical protein
MSGSIHRGTVAARARAALVGLTAACTAAALTACQAPLPVVNDSNASGLTTTATPPDPGAGHHGTTTPAAPTTTSRATTTTTAAAPAGADPDTNCTLIVPPVPLSAAGLATPYRFVATDPGAGACHEANPDQSAFVEATILDPATGRLATYHPLVIDDGTQPAIPPVQPTLPRGAVVGVWFGFQADVLTLRQRHLRRGVMRLRYPAGNDCVNGSPGSPFSQFAYCNAPQFFAAANAAIKAGKLHIPALGTGKDGKPCPTTRDFSVVDQDQSDNLPGSYLATADGRIAQFSAANQRALSDATVLDNASDNGLVDDLLDPALGCHPATAPDLSAGGAPSPALALNELQAAAEQGPPVALVPLNDPMTVDNNGKASVAKTNLYRAGVDMPAINPATETAALYCTDMAAAAVPRLALDEPLTAAVPSPDTGVAADLHGFLVARLDESWTNLGCPALTSIATPDASAAGTTVTATTTPVATTDAAATTAAAAATDAAAVAATDSTATDPATATATDGASPTIDPTAVAGSTTTATAG